MKTIPQTGVSRARGWGIGRNGAAFTPVGARRISPDRTAVTGKQHGFLGTKVISPQFSGLIARPRLLGLAAQLSTKRLAVIKAPAGFGKSSLAAAWSEQFQRTGNLVAWLTIDPDDNEPAQFLFYVAQALRSAHEEIGARAIALINETTLINPHAVVSTLINDLVDIDEEVYLFWKTTIGSPIRESTTRLDFLSDMLHLIAT